MADTTHLQLPLMAAAQAQKHVTHNEAILRLDAIVQLAVIDRDLTAPPANPGDGDRYIVASGGSGAWAAWDWNIAWFVDGVWTKLEPREGWRLWVEDEDLLLVWDGAAWVAIEGGGGGGNGGSGDPPTLQVFTTSGTWNKPAGLKFAVAEVVGGGGSGGGSGTNGGAGGGAGGGGYAMKHILASALGSTETVTVGAGGAPGATGENPGNAGGTSSFGSHCSATGGQAGLPPTGASSTPSGGSGSGGDLNMAGQSGTARIASGATGTTPGGASPMGYGFGGHLLPSDNLNNHGQDGGGRGGGGGGGRRISSDRQGGAGTAGIVIVREFY
jgi:hypothetical protein